MNLFPFFSFGSLAVGIFAAFFARKFPSRGWVGIVLLLVAGMALSLVEPGNSAGTTRSSMSILFLLVAPFAVVYSFRTKRHAPDRLPALAAFVGAFVISAAFLMLMV